MMPEEGDSRQAGPPGYSRPEEGRQPSREGIARLYVGNLPPNLTEGDLQAAFERYGKIYRVTIKRGQTPGAQPFAFVEYEDPRDAEDALKEKDGAEMDGCRLRVEIPFNCRPNSSYGGRVTKGRGVAPRRGKYTVEISGLPPSGSWQDLKDHFREVGECMHADVFNDGTGEVSFATRREVELGIERLDGATFRSHENEKTRLYLRERSERSSRHERDRSRSPRGYRDGPPRRRSPPEFRDSRDYSPRPSGPQRHRDSRQYCSPSRKDRRSDRRDSPPPREQSPRRAHSPRRESLPHADAPPRSKDRGSPPRDLSPRRQQGRRDSGPRKDPSPYGNRMTDGDRASPRRAHSPRESYRKMDRPIDA